MNCYACIQSNIMESIDISVLYNSVRSIIIRLRRRNIIYADVFIHALHAHLEKYFILFKKINRYIVNGF